jgi:hypothetical protein
MTTPVNFAVPLKAENLLSSWATVSFSKNLCYMYQLVVFVSVSSGRLLRTWLSSIKDVGIS